MARKLPTHEEVTRAYNRPCHFTCRSCARPCSYEHSHNHAFDCCGEIVAHVMGPSLTPQIITNPMQAGYLTGPSKTGVPA